jgi:DNA-binding NarL/FixJ family response regulator
VLDSIFVADMSRIKSSLEYIARAANWLPYGTKSGLPSDSRLASIPPRLSVKASHKKWLHLIVETDDISVLRLIHAALPSGCRLHVRCADVAVDEIAAPGDITYLYPPPDKLPELTTRQREVLDYLLKGLTNKAIARKLNLSHFTVRNHVSQLMRLIGVATRKEAVARFADCGVSK